MSQSAASAALKALREAEPILDDAVLGRALRPGDFAVLQRLVGAVGRLLADAR